MHRRLAIRAATTAIVLLSALGCRQAPGLTRVMKSDEAYGNANLPAKALKALNAATRVRGIRAVRYDGVNYEHNLHYTGNTAQLNEMLKALAALRGQKGATLSVTLQPGRGCLEAGSFGGTKDIDYNWSVTIEELPVKEGTFTERKTEDGETVIEMREGDEETGSSLCIDVEICIDGPVDLGALRLPLECEAVAGKRIEDFVQAHNKRRPELYKLVAPKEKGPDTRPTSEELILDNMPGRGIYGMTPDGNSPDGNSTDSNSAERSAIEASLEEYFPATDPNFVARVDLAGAMRQLILLNQAQATLPTVYNTPGPYYRIKQVFLAKADDEKLKEMLGSDRAVVRVMAMDCLLERHNTNAFKYLRPSLGSRAILRSRVGCVGIAPTEGSFVRYLMMSYIEEQRVDVDGEKHLYLRARLTSEQTSPLMLEILSRHDTATMHQNLASSMFRWRDASTGAGGGTGIFDAPSAEREPAAPLDLPALRKLSGGLDDSDIIKAVGRIKSIVGLCSIPFQRKELPEVESFLIQCLGDKELDSQARLAAGSALTRWADPNAAKALESAKDALNRLEPGAGTKIWETFQYRRQYEKDMAVVCQSYAAEVGGIFATPPESPDPNEFTEAIILLAGKYDHPMVWEGVGWFAESPLVPGTDDGSGRTDALSRAAAKTLLKVSARLAEQVEPWNTYGDMPYLMEHELNWDEHWQAECKARPELIPPAPSAVKRFLSEKDYEQFRRDVRAAVAREEKAAGRKEDATSKRDKTQEGRK